MVYSLDDAEDEVVALCALVVRYLSDVASGSAILDPGQSPVAAIELLCDLEGKTNSA